MKTRLVFANFGLGLVLALTPACGSDGGSGADASNNPNVDGSTNPTVDASTGGFVELIAADFTIPAGEELYRCARITVTEDVYISSFRALSPLGTHHTVTTIDTSGAADGEFPCSANTLSDQMIYASGVGTDVLEFPAGVAMKVSAGQKLLLNLHLYNTSEAPISGRAGTLVKMIPANEVEQEAEMIFTGTFIIALPAMQESSVQGDCQYNTNATVMTVWPHMHQLGTHMKVDIVRAGGGMESLHDAPYSFEEQLNYPLTNTVQLNSGDRVRVTCTYNNDTMQTVFFGDSSTQEMCFAGMYQYPKTGMGLFCAEGGGF